MTATVNIHEAKTHFSKLIERVRLGEEIIAKAGEPVARLVPEKNAPPPHARRRSAGARILSWSTDPARNTLNSAGMRSRPSPTLMAISQMLAMLTKTPFALHCRSTTGIRSIGY